MEFLRALGILLGVVLVGASIVAFVFAVGEVKEDRDLRRVGAIMLPSDLTRRGCQLIILHFLLFLAGIFLIDALWVR